MKLIDARRAQVLSIGKLAEKAGVTYNTVAAIEKGKKPKRIETAHKIATALSTHPAHIDEFQHLVGTPEDLRRQLTQAQIAEDLAAIEAGKREGYIDAEEFWHRVEQEPISVAA